MQALNLPKADLRIQQREKYPVVFDILRRRYVKLTPEEWVRQHFVHYLMNVKGYPSSVIGNEVEIELFDTRKRCDSVVYDNGANPRMIIEYKATDVPITQRVFEQISRYNIRLHVRWLIVSNGLQHYCCKVDYETGRCAFLPDIPSYEEVVQDEP